MLSNPPPLRVLFLSAEAVPLVKVGGLGDVGGSLPTALRLLSSESPAGGENPSRQVDIRVALPFYGTIRRDRYKSQLVASVQVPHTSGPISAQAYALTVNQVPYYLIAGKPIHPEAPVYSLDAGYDAHKFIFFSLAALEAVRNLNWQPHILHANDWHTAAAVYWLSLHRDQDPFFRETISVQCIHNLLFLGDGAEFPMESFYLPSAPPGTLPDWARHLPLPLGMLTADHLITVSPSYARDMLHSDLGSGLEGLFQRRAHHITGILNGIDYKIWDPDNDPAIPVTYTSDSLFVREANKAALLNELGFIPSDTGLEERNTPLIALISRMDYQKGTDIAIAALYQLAEQSKQPWRAVLLGKGLYELECSARQLQRDLPERVRAIIRYDEPLSHRIYAAADILLVPSRNEACGIAQMIAQHYGCVPIGRATGGIRDTILDYHETSESTGFLFANPTPEALLQTLNDALNVFRDKNQWKAIQKRGMERDFSWNRSAQAYYELYISLIQNRNRKHNML